MACNVNSTVVFSSCFTSIVIILLQTMADQLKPDDIIVELGGCGRYQWRLNILLHVLKTVVAFSVTSMIIISATPTWRCADDAMCSNDNASVPGLNQSAVCPEKSCFIGNNTKACTSFVFDDSMRTMVSEVRSFFFQ